MIKVLIASVAWLTCTSLLNTLHAQDDTIEDWGSYVKSNIAVSKFRILGVTPKQYAKCLETENFYEPEKRLKFLVIGKTTFTDDGQGYDLKADDGILTSNQLFYYSSRANLLPGEYKETPDFNELLADEEFAYRPETTEKLIIRCKFKWTKCKDLSTPQQALICQIAGWPFGGFEILECEITFEG